jgi:Histidine phosphatase superfamily (branch 2)
MYKRWKKLEKDFYMKKAKSDDSSKISDVYDCIKHDMIYNPLLYNTAV